MVDREIGKPLRCLHSGNRVNMVTMNSIIVVLNMVSDMKRWLLAPHNIIV